MAKTLVTTYINPDLDGVASCLAYAGLLKSKNIDCEVLFWGKPQPEVEFILPKLHIWLPVFTDKHSINWESVVIIDTSSIKRLADVIKPSTVHKIIDHHPAEDGKEFVNAKIQNEEVGATATLVVDKLKKNNIKISNDLAALLYTAIYQNTLNMLIGVTDRDKEAASFLFDNFKIDKNLIEEMFKNVVSYTLANLQSVLESDFKEFEVKGRKCVGGQVLFYDAKPHLAKLVNVVKEINVFKNDPSFVKADDLKFNKTFLYCSDDWLQDIIKTKLKVTFNNCWTELSPIILRKKIVKVLAEN